MLGRSIQLCAEQYDAACTPTGATTEAGECSPIMVPAMVSPVAAVNNRISFRIACSILKAACPLLLARSVAAASAQTSDRTRDQYKLYSMTSLCSIGQWSNIEWTLPAMRRKWKWPSSLRSSAASGLASRDFFDEKDDTASDRRLLDLHKCLGKGEAVRGR